MKKLGRILVFFVFIISCFLIFPVTYYSYKIPNTYKTFVGRDVKFNFKGVNIKKVNSSSSKVSKSKKFVNEEIYKASLFGLIPIKNISVKRYNKVDVVPCGTPFGVKFLTDGVIIVNTQEVSTKSGEKNPSKEAGLKKGDIVEYINGEKIRSNKDLQKIIAKSGGKPLKLIYNRKFKQYETSITPVFSSKNKLWQTGLLVRDSSAGIGTITFCTKEGVFGGLGHPVCDVDTGEKLPLGSGEVVKVYIKNIKPGVSGSPGELSGIFYSSENIGNVNLNTDCGLYGKLKKPIYPHKPLEIGFKQEVKMGKAQIYSTIKGAKPKKYEIEIEAIDYNSENKNYVIKITDKELLKKTGGIVQGMSGSPIIQDNKFIGAITHVFLNDPTRGYGVLAETMLEVADGVLN